MFTTIGFTAVSLIAAALAAALITLYWNVPRIRYYGGVSMNFVYTVPGRVYGYFPSLHIGNPFTSTWGWLHRSRSQPAPLHRSPVGGVSVLSPPPVASTGTPVVTATTTHQSRTFIPSAMSTGVVTPVAAQSSTTVHRSQTFSPAPSAPPATTYTTSPSTTVHRSRTFSPTPSAPPATMHTTSPSTTVHRGQTFSPTPSAPPATVHTTSPSTTVHRSSTFVPGGVRR